MRPLTFNALCGQYETRINRSSYSTIRGRQPLASAYLRVAKVHRRYAVKTSTKADDRKADVMVSYADFRTLDRDFDEAGLTDCTVNRRS